MTAPRPQTQFIYAPDKWSFLVAVIAASAGVLSLTSDRVGRAVRGVHLGDDRARGRQRRPGAGLRALDEVRGSLLQLGVNITGMALAGWLTLVVQKTLWGRFSARRARLRARICARLSPDVSGRIAQGLVQGLFPRHPWEIPP